LTAFTPDQLRALAIVAMKLYHLIYTIALAFFGCYDLLIGYLTLKSTFIPRPIGVLMGIAGLGWLTFFIPPIATSSANKLRCLANQTPPEISTLCEETGK
jgi:hypothetical protein